MKHDSFVIDSEKIEGFLSAHHNKPVFYSLIYGSDEGAVKIITEKIMSRFFTNADELDLGLQKISYHDITCDLTIFNDFFSSNSLFVSKKLLLIEECGENFNQEILQILQKHNFSNKQIAIVFVAGDIRRNSKIVKSIESISQALIVTCYKPDHKGIINIITNWLRSKMVSYESNLPQELAMVMPANRLLIEHELEKLVIYCNNQHVTISAVNNLFANYSAETSIDYIAGLFFKRNIRSFLLELSKVDEQNYNNIFILRALQNYAVRLKQVKALIQSNHKLEKALATLTPPIFFKNKEIFVEVVKFIDLEQINEYIYQLLMLELSLKKDNMINKDIYTVHSLCKILS